jgi:hypothetical protein
MNKKMRCMEVIVQLARKEKFDFSFQIVNTIDHEIIIDILFIYSGIVEPIPVGQPAKDYLEQNVNKTLIKALTALCKEKPKDPMVNFAYLKIALFIFHW